MALVSSKCSLVYIIFKHPNLIGNHFSNEASKISCYHVIHQAIPQWGISLSW
ncbi:hypothetical protein HanXRQr2_Chr04g0144651 [Helianthus annuus]|uniref:Uncharacterized protein n=1 Tax=Helianthus annuus TaxID=4232 RepID=A0A9K3J4Z5_HELAN|nr:hypothetical protein HanXRQr2_Chr04g0144651 [Helianthus annuus]KAJ0586835.1 hypothetical protein HanIR_Chr04g0156281 [Helianthus annuus]